MTIKEINIALQKAKESCDGFSWVDEEFSDLLIKIAEHLIGREDTKPPGVPPGFIPVVKFEKDYKFISAETLVDYCRDNALFSNNCGLLVGKRWYVHEERTLEFLKKRPIFKKRMERLGGNW